MAAVPDPDEVLRSTKEKENFQRVARLLISGGTTLLREIFDQLCPPCNLSTTLKNPATEKKLRSAKLTKAQRDCLYPSPGVYGKSADFDVTLLFRLLRTICNITPPATGWDAFPSSIDHSLAAELVRIKSYRNSVYAHVSQNMEITDHEFLMLWQDISEALLRIAGQISPAKKTAWKEAIDNFSKDSLTAEDEQNVQELLRWHRNDVEVKEFIELSDKKVQEGMECLRTSIREKAQDIKDQFGEELKTTSDGIQSTVREKAQDITDQFGKELKTTSDDIQSLVQKESQDMKDQFGEGLRTASHDVQSLVREKAQDIKHQFREELKTTTLEIKNQLGEELQAIRDEVGKVQQSIDGPSSSAGTSQAPGGQFKITRLLFTK